MSHTNGIMSSSARLSVWPTCLIGWKPFQIEGSPISATTRVGISDHSAHLSTLEARGFQNDEILRKVFTQIFYAHAV